MKQVCRHCGKKKELKPYIPETIDPVVLVDFMCNDCLKKKQVLGKSV